MNKFLFAFTFILSINAIAQDFNFTEERTISLNKDYDFTITDHVKSGMALDNENNKIIVGGFDGIDVNFGESNVISAEEHYNGFIAKYDENNQLLWLKNIGGTIFEDTDIFSDRKFSTFDFASDVALDSENNIYVLATIDVGTTETIDLDPEHPTTNSVITTSNSPSFFTKINPNIFLIKYNPSGTLLWYKEIQDNFNDIALKISIDTNDHVYLTGYSTGFTGNFIDFDPSQNYPDDRDLIQGDFFRLGFIVQYDSEGNFVLVHGIGNGIVSEININASNSGNIYFAGSFNGSTSSDPANSTSGLSLFKNSPNPIYISSLGHFELVPENQDIFIAKHDNAGQLLWVNTISSISENRVVEIVVDKNEDVFVSGYIKGDSVDFDRNSTSPSDIRSTTAGGSAFVAKYNSADGRLDWAKTIEGGNFSKVRDLAIKNDKLFLGGEFNGNITINNSELSTNVTNPFIATIDTDGNWESAGQIEKSSFASISDITIANDDTIQYFGFEAENTVLTDGDVNTLNVQKMFLGQVNDRVLSVNDANKEMFSISPNPVSDYLHIAFEEIKPNSTIKIYNALGQMVFSKQYVNTKSEIVDINTFNRGIYMLMIEENGTVSHNTKIIKR